MSGPPGERVLACEDLVIGYRATALLPPISLELRRGSFTAVVGRNGSGKSTWFKTLLGLVPPLSGRVVGTASLRRAYAPQLAAIDPILPLRAREIVSWGRLAGWSFLKPRLTAGDQVAIDKALALAGAGEIAGTPYRELSEGQKQRVLLARVLATEADVVLLDEPTASMDAVAERETMARLAQLAVDQSIAVVVVSHQFSIPTRFADNMLFMDREGPTVLVGPPDSVFCHPAFRQQYGDDYCARATSGYLLGPTAR